MAKKTATPADEDIRPAAGFTPAPGLGDPLPPSVIQEEEEKAKEHPLKDDPALKDAHTAADEILRLRAELAAIKAGGPAYAAGKKHRVSLKDGPTAVVQPLPGEHPYEAFKRMTGVINSMHAPTIAEASDDEECGVCDYTGKVPKK